LGFSFTDPNIDYILSRVRVQYEQHQRHHYCIQKRVSKSKEEFDDEFKYRLLKQDYFIRDLKRFGIYTVLVDEYSQITALLEKIATSYKRSSIFISGAAEEYGSWTRADAEAVVHKLSYRLASKKNRIITGFGVGVGGAVINGALAYLNDAGKTITDEDIVMRPFPQVATGDKSLAEQWTEYRKKMIDYAGIAIFVFGNNRDGNGDIVPSKGVREEFDLCIAAGVRPLPIGATGFMAESLFNEVLSNFAKVYPDANPEFRRGFDSLGDKSTRPEDLIPIVQKLIEYLKKG